MAQSINKLNNDLTRLRELLDQEIKIILTKNNLLNLLNEDKIGEVINQFYTKSEFISFVTSLIASQNESNNIEDLKSSILSVSNKFAKELINKVFDNDASIEESIDSEAYEICKNNLGDDVRLAANGKIINSIAPHVITMQFQHIFDSASSQLVGDIEFEGELEDIANWFEDHIELVSFDNVDVLQIHY